MYKRQLLIGHAVTQEAVLLLLVGQLFLRFQLFLQLGQLAVFQLGGLVQVVLTLGFLNGGIGLLDLLAQGLHFADGVLLVLPLCFHAAELILQLGQLFFQQMCIRDRYAAIFKDYICDVGQYLADADAAGKKVLFEAQLGAEAGLDVVQVLPAQGLLLGFFGLRQARGLRCV